MQVPLKILSEAIEISPEFAMAFSNRGVAKITMGNKKKVVPI